MKLYDRVYYTLFRMMLKLADMFSMERETPRTEVALMLSLLTAFNIIPALFLLSAFTGIHIFSGRKVYIMIGLLPVIAFNFLLIFYKIDIGILKSTYRLHGMKRNGKTF